VNPLRTSPQEDLAGLTLPDRFQVIRKLGSGGFGVVYEVEDAERGVRCALKQLRRVEPASIYRFKREFRTLAGLSHPNLVRLFELFAVEDSWCFTLELVRGATPFDAWVRGTAATAHHALLAQETDPGLESDDALPAIDEFSSALGTSSSGIREGTPSDAEVQRARRALPQLVSGVLALHQNGILHRDLKPSNVLVDADGRLRILDFGLASAALGPDPADSARAGTPAYMSPEQARGAPLTLASDWYSVGVILYEALTGRPPFSGTAPDIMAGKQLRQPRAPRSLRRGLPEDLCTLALELLDRDPAARPSGIAVARRVGIERDIDASPRQTLESTFVGRHAELAALRSAFDATRCGQTVVAHVHGPSGIGKSALVRRFVSDLSLNSEVVLLEGRSYERESVPFKALDELVDALGRYLARLKPLDAASLLPRDAPSLVRLFPALGRLALMANHPGRAPCSDLHELRRRAFGAFRDVLARITDGRPLILLLDDVHWGDADSADLLRNLLAPPDVPPLLLIASYRRTGTIENDLLRVLRSPQAVDSAWQVVDIPLEALSPQDATSLAQRLLAEARASAFDAAALAEEGARSPLLIAELVRAAARGDGGPGLVSMGYVVALRRAHLGSEPSQLLELLAISHRPVTADVLALAVGQSVSDTLQHLEELREEQLATLSTLRGAQEYEIFHDRFRGAMVEATAADRVRQLHARLARALETMNADPEVIYPHLWAAGEYASVAGCAERAGDRASEGAAFEQAAEHYGFALTSLERIGSEVAAPQSGSLESRIRRKLAETLSRAGRGAEAAAHYMALAQRRPPDAEALRRKAGEQMLRAGRIHEGMQTLGAVVEKAGLPFPHTPRAALLSLLWRRTRLRWRGYAFRARPASHISPAQLENIDLCWTLGNGLSGIDVVRSAHYHALGLWLALESGDPYRIARSLALEAALASLESVERATQAEPVLERAERIATEYENPHALGWVLSGRALGAWVRTDLERCVEYCEQAVRRLRERSDETFREIGSIEVWFHLHALFLLGRLDQVAARAPACAREAEARGDRYTASTVKAYVLPLLWAVRDRPDEGRREAEAAIAVWPKDVWYHQHWAHLRAQCFLDLYEGQGSRIVERTAHARPRMAAAMHLRLRTPRIEVTYLEGRGALERSRNASSRRERDDWTALTRARSADLRAEDSALARVYGDALAAALAAQADPRAGSESFAALANAFSALGMKLHAAAARHRSVHLLSPATHSAPDDGDARELLARSGVVAPERFVRMLLP
jgi:serine/threonine protein kinase